MRIFATLLLLTNFLYSADLGKVLGDIYISEYKKRISPKSWKKSDSVRQRKAWASIKSLSQEDRIVLYVTLFKDFSYSSEFAYSLSDEIIKLKDGIALKKYLESTENIKRFLGKDSLYDYFYCKASMIAIYGTYNSSLNSKMKECSYLH